MGIQNHHHTPKKSHKKIKILDSQNHPLPSPEQSFFSKKGSPIPASFSPLDIINTNKAGKKIAKNHNDEEFMLELSTSQYSLWRHLTPKKTNSPEHIQFSSPKDRSKQHAIIKKLVYENQDDTEKFEFTVKVGDLIKTPRTISQNRVMNGISAKEYLEAYGAIFSFTEKEVKLNWAHRRAWFMNGSQSQDNLDAMTKAANLNTLYKVEYPIKNILLSDRSVEVQVKGVVHFLNKKDRVVKNITYHFYWGKNKHCTVNIDTLSLKKISREEIKATNALIEKEINRPKK